MISDIPNSDYDGFFLLSKAFCYLSLGIKKSTTAHHSWWNAGWNGINLSIFYSRSWCKTFSILVGYDNVSESQGHNRWRNLWGAKKMQLICLCTNKINYASLLKVIWCCYQPCNGDIFTKQWRRILNSWLYQANYGKGCAKHKQKYASICCERCRYNPACIPRWQWILMVCAR